MHIYPHQPSRELPQQHIHTDFVVAGGGLAGVCSAVAAARNGLKVALIQDRPILGGNASSEVRLWALGATSHLGNNNRWAREGGIMGEILETNLYRNKEGNPIIFDLLLLDFVKREANIQLFLNTAIFSVDSAEQQIKSITGFNSIDETFYHFSAPLFCDSTGDGLISYLSGASFRIGAEDQEEFDERMAPDEHFGHMLGHSIYFYTRQTDNPVEFVPPQFALDDITEIPRYKRLHSKLNGCDLWWLEWGGKLDTVHDSEKIKWELWKIVWGVWNYIKNSGQFPDAKNMTIDWVGLIPGKRESRRVMGDYLLNQKDIIEQRDHYDAVSFGGWSIDLHPADGVYSKLDACMQYHSKGIYTIPFRSLYSRDISNLFIGGRNISATHVAFGSTRVMCTCGQNGHVIGEAAALCFKQGYSPRELAQPDKIGYLQTQIMQHGGYIPRQKMRSLPATTVNASSTWKLEQLANNQQYLPLDKRFAVMLPLKQGEKVPAITLNIQATQTSDLMVKLLVAKQAYNHTPEIMVDSLTLICQKEDQTVTLDSHYIADTDRYLFICFEPNPVLSIALTDENPPAIKTVWNQVNEKVAKSNRQIVTGDYGVDEFDFWLPLRRPQHILPAMQFSPALKAYSAEAVVDGNTRPNNHTHVWVADKTDKQPQITLEFEQPTSLSDIGIMFDNDFDHAMETVQYGHSEHVSLQCVKAYRLYADDKLVAQVDNNFRSWNNIHFETPIVAHKVTLIIDQTYGEQAAVYAIHCHVANKL